MADRDKIVIFGGSGYVGGAVAEYMKREFDIVVADIRPPRSSDGLGFVRCDVRESRQVKEVLSNASAALYFSVVQIPQINSETRLGYEVNVLGLQNVCEAALQIPTTKGVILAGTWHVFGEMGLSGRIDESTGFNPDKVEDRAKVYALSKIAQESIMRLYDNMGASLSKTFAVIRMGTVLGEDMPDATAASLFIRNGLMGRALMPYRDSMYRPMLYVDLQDVCEGYAIITRKLTSTRVHPGDGNLPHIVNMLWPEPLTIINLAQLVRDLVNEETRGRIVPTIEVKDTGIVSSFTPADKSRFHVDATNALSLLQKRNLTDPKESLRRLIRNHLAQQESHA